jgi:hypothetical protein
MKAVDAAKAVGAGLTVTDKIDVNPDDVDRKDVTSTSEGQARGTPAHDAAGAPVPPS